MERHELFVGGLPLDIEEPALIALFEPYGTPSSVNVLPNRSNTGQRCAFVTFATLESAQASVDGLSGKHVVAVGMPPIVVRLRQSKAQHQAVQVSTGPNPPYQMPHQVPAAMYYDQCMPTMYANQGPPPPPVQQAESASMTLFVGSLPECSEQELTAAFSPYGEITEITLLPQNSRTGARCAFVNFKTPAEAQAAATGLDGKLRLLASSEPAVVRVRDQRGAGSKRAAAAPPPMQAPCVGSPAGVPGSTAAYIASLQQQLAQAHALAGFGAAPAGFAPGLGVDPNLLAQLTSGAEMPLPGVGLGGFGMCGGAVGGATGYDPAAATMHAAAGGMGGFNIPGAYSMAGGAPVGQQAPPPQPRTPGTDEAKLFIGNLPAHATEAALSMVFSQFGELEQIAMLPPKGNRGLMCAFVSFKEASVAQSALTLNGTYKMSPTDIDPLVVRIAGGDNKRRRM